MVDRLGPNDLAAIVFAQDNRHAQDFTADRAALRRAIETYNPRPLHPFLARAASLGVLERSNAFLRRMPLRTLPPGEYLLRFVAEAAGRRVSREVRFSIP